VGLAKGGMESLGEGGSGIVGPMTGAGMRVDWLGGGDVAFAALLDAIGAARRTICFEIYILAEGLPGEPVRDALAAAAERGVEVRLLVDGLGSMLLPERFLEPLKAAGAHCRIFNPVSQGRLPVRDHRKLLAVDGKVAIVGGFNVAPEYLGDGVARGWCDVGVRLEGCVAEALARSFDTMWERSAGRPPRFARLRGRPPSRPETGDPAFSVLASDPGRGRGAFLAALRRDLEKARDVQIVAAYFLPGLRLRRDLMRVVRRGGRVRILVPGRTDVPMSRQAARFLYAGLLRAGVEILEYQPQILHAKLYIVDSAVHVGSSNLDTRSLHLNHEIMVRAERPDVSAMARDWMESACGHAKRIEPRTWGGSRGWIERLREFWSYILLARVDPYLSRWLSRKPR